MKQQNKLKVAWICHFSNSEIRKHLSLFDECYTSSIKGLLGKKRKCIYSDYAPWVTILISEFQKMDDVELHVIAPVKGLSCFLTEFEVNRIFYHFFSPTLPIRHTYISKWLKLKKHFFLSRYWVKRVLKKIQPDIVNLIGTENPYYSITVLDIKDIPVYISAQTVYTNPSRKIYSNICDELRWNLELKIHKKEKYFGCTGRMYRDLILSHNPDAIIFKMFFPITKPPKIEELPKKYDFVFFAAGVTAKKGIEDAIEALAIAKKSKQDISLNVVGSCAAEYKEYLMRKIKQVDLTGNVSFNGYFPIHADMLKHIKKARFALLPVKLDVISGTIVEAALLELPVVTYKTTGTPYLNKNGEAILISEIGIIEDLAGNMIKLLENHKLAEKLKKNAKQFVETEFDNTKNAHKLVKDYKAVLDHYHNNKPIPEGLLFNTKEFPLY